MKSLTLKQKQFADEYIRTGNAYQSAVNAGYSVSYARGNAIKLLENVSINKYIDDNLEIIQKESIAETDEIMRYLTRVLRVEEKEEILVYVGDGMQEIQTIQPSAKDRIKAAELLGKRYSCLLYTSDAADE